MSKDTSFVININNDKAPKTILMPMRSDERLAEKIATYIANNLKFSSLLDIGCGDGVAGNIFGEGVIYKGLDISDACIYEQKTENPRIEYVKPQMIPNIIEDGGPWDVIFLLDVLEHTREFTDLFELAIKSSSKYIIVSLPNELFFLDRLRMLFGHELNAHSLALLKKPEGFKHQYIININKAKDILVTYAKKYDFILDREVQRPLLCKRNILQFLPYLLRKCSSSQMWSMGSIFVFRNSSTDVNN
ncbi:oxidoreductase [Synechococcus sp. Minos11]|uniref:class I SAM-dependent methyltransferase n=1 Tax=Synechococcus sp. Minos11 TaxID=221341 RepID=UPI001648DD1C|nr:methyltransferase domain-containing protein [Synechococcus sp. Minos11]QNJ07675.1 oxidoreductase [Synechococcus sp. Minos11]